MPNSNLIGSNLVAMQRPSTELMLASQMISQFKSFNIVSIFNLTEPGEHPFCGAAGKGKGLLPRGFTYNPEDFMNEGGMIF